MPLRVKIFGWAGAKFGKLKTRRNGTRNVRAHSIVYICDGINLDVAIVS